MRYLFLIFLIPSFAFGQPDLINIFISSVQDQYITSAFPGNVGYENGVQIRTNACRIVNLFAFNSGTNQIFLSVRDTSDAGRDGGPVRFLYPVGAKSMVSIAVQGGEIVTNGVYIRAYTDTQLTSVAGPIMFYRVGTRSP